MRRTVTAGPKINLRESECKAEITNLLKRLGWKTYSTSDGRPSRNTPGLPDIWAMSPNGRAPCWIEVKAENGTASLEQVAFAALCHLSGTGYVIGGTAQVMEYLKRIGAI